MDIYGVPGPITGDPIVWTAILELVCWSHLHYWLQGGDEHSTQLVEVLKRDRLDRLEKVNPSSAGMSLTAATELNLS